MSRFDASHDYQHVLRVLSLARHIEAKERALHPEIRYDADVVTLASLLHDVGDRKYLQDNQAAGGMVEGMLLKQGAPPELAAKVQTIVTHVSYSCEVADPMKVREVISKHPELAAVQDADRLDALGAVGIGRAFTFGATKRAEGGMARTMEHFTEKLEKLEGMMKTETGREMARLRTERLRMFRSWWEEETLVGRTVDRALTHKSD
ncbi:hypothetical protein GP486_004370 [Trichoglossum hirsutum]|uniref:HD/PDEase domain-containing protein n=1 Tax=Trichoglossum hirsutum TaxID=265104 RepID=A0A9P8LB69_9PEZI|nr:hypothetical protein GP486_004370 [Trichoglossum hirsutum]